MGLDINGTRLLLHARGTGVDFTRTATIGRQNLHLSRDQLEQNLAAHAGAQQARTAISMIQSQFAEPFLKLLGAQVTDSFDNSPYEGATHIHDMNFPIPAQYKEKYSVVIDGGSLEHVFNYAIALKNCLEMVEIGGHFIAITPTNNFMGHGFYQFSPELFYSCLTENNGFHTPMMLLFEDVSSPQWIEVPNPHLVHHRVTFCNDKPAYLFVQSKRISNCPVFGTPPQQSDYVSLWNNVTNP